MKSCADEVRVLILAHFLQQFSCMEMCELYGHKQDLAHSGQQISADFIG
jgi:hypothetical protein